MKPEIRDDRQLRALTGVSTEKFGLLEVAFARSLADEKQSKYQKQVDTGKLQRKPGGGQKGKLPTVREKLIFVLYYLKVYPTFDEFGAQFGMARSKACENLHFLYPVLAKALASLKVFPHRKFETVEEFRAACQNIETLLIDATERPHRRPIDNEEQEDLYSGKKESHHKNTIIATVSKWILFLGSTFSGHCHDYTMLKTEFSPELPWFETIRALLDSGYQGICNDFIGEHIEIPHKKTTQEQEKSRNNSYA
jgi:hypothetical protein